MHYIAEKIEASLSLRVFLPLLALALATTWYGLGPSLDQIQVLTGARFVDMQPGLTATALTGQLSAYSPATVRFYLWWSAFDFAWPFITYTTMLFITAWLLRRCPAGWSRFLWLFVAVAYGTVLLDWAENIGFVRLAVSPPADPGWVAALAVLFHRAKLFLNMVYNVGFVAALIAAMVTTLRLRRRHRANA
jgi:hypothetical protein